MEEWRDVVGAEGWYQVSDQGRVRRIAAGQGAIAGRILKPQLKPSGYMAVMLSVGGERRTCRIHRLVCAAFHGDPPTAEYQVNHKNGRKADNRAENLEWVTQSENGKYSFRVLGRVPPNQRGERNNHSKLTAAQVREIRKLYAGGGHTHGELGRRFGVSRTIIGEIVRRQKWVHI